MGLFDSFRSKSNVIQALPAPSYTSLPEGYVEALERAILPDEKRLAILATAGARAGRSGYALTCADKVAKSAASVPWILEVEDNGGWSRVHESTHPAFRFLEQPNRLQTRARFIRMILLSYQTAGKIYIFAHRDRAGDLADLVYESAQSVEVKTDRDGGRVYSVKRGDVVTVYDDRDTLIWYYPDPLDPRRHSSPWAIALDDRQADAEASTWQRESMATRVVPDLLFQVGRNITPAQAEAIQQGLKARKSPGSGRSSLLVDHDVTVHNLNGTGTAEVDFIDSRKSFQEAISAVFGVPRAVLGILENATLANLEASEIMFWNGTVLPYLSELGEELARFLSREFGQIYRVRPDTSAVTALRAYVAQSASAATAYHAIGVPVDVISDRLSLGFPRFTGSDTGFISSGSIPVEDALTGGGFTGSFSGGFGGL